MWGLRADEVKGRSFVGLDIGLPVDRLDAPLRRVVSSVQDGYETMEIQAVNRRGKAITAHVTCSPLRLQGGPTTGVIVLMEERNSAEPPSSDHMPLPGPEASPTLIGRPACSGVLSVRRELPHLRFECRGPQGSQNTNHAHDRGQGRPRRFHFALGRHRRDAGTAGKRRGDRGAALKFPPGLLALIKRKNCVVRPGLASSARPGSSRSLTHLLARLLPCLWLSRSHVAASGLGPR